MSDEQVVDQAAEQIADAVVNSPEVEQAVEQAVEEVLTEEAPVAPVEGSVEIYYNGQVVTERLETVTADGRLCKLADGSTAYVPLSILGE